MATKKSQPTKKKSSKAVAQARPLTWKFYVTTIGIFAVAVATVIVISMLAANYIHNQQVAERRDRIQSIYSSLAIDKEKYQLEHTNVFGDKRAYDWDKNRSYSSEKNYIHGDTVTNTFNELDGKIRAAGFVFVDEPYPGSVQKQFHYKSEKGEFIRLSVSSKQYDDAIRNAAVMGQDIVTVIDRFQDGTDAGPANVTIKVNLDDNNE